VTSAANLLGCQAMKSTRSRSSETLSARFRAYRRSLQLGAAAVLSLSTVRALDAESVRDAGRHVARSMKARALDRSLSDADETEIAAIGAIPLTGEAHGLSLRGDLLTPAERARLAADLGRAPRAVVTYATPAPVIDPAELLPADHVAAEVAPYEPILMADAEIDAQAAHEAAIEIAAMERDAAAVAFESDLASGITDYPPAAPAMPAKVRALAVTAEPSVAAPVAAPSDHEALRLALLSRVATLRKAVATVRANA
jgi:hypothetical protein